MPLPGAGVVAGLRPRGEINEPLKGRIGSHLSWRPPAPHPRLCSRGTEVVIGVGRSGCPASPSLRTGLADLPHPALRLVVSPARGLADRLIGFLQTEQPTLGKEAVGPARLICTANIGNPSPLLLLAQQAPQPPAYPTVQVAEGPRPAVLEVAEPAPQRRVEMFD